MKKIILVFSILFSMILNVYAEKLSFEGSTCNIQVTYNESVHCGDAICVKMNIRSKDRSKKNVAETTAVLELHNAKKKVESVKFFFANQKSRQQNSADMLAFLPLSVWLSNDNYTLKIVYHAFGSEKEELSLPFTFLETDFIKETIELNAQNTAIRTDTSPERAAQIAKLNSILETVNHSNVFTLKPFVQPVNSTRRTSFFGDKRIFKYSNGKSSTSVHYGVDYGVPEGTLVTSCADGKVVMAENRITTGWSVVVEHSPGLYSLYYHLSVLSVKEGQMIKQGEKLGLSGSTGLATGPHLHWEVRLNMCAVSPDFFTNDYAFTQGEK